MKAKKDADDKAKRDAERLAIEEIKAREKAAKAPKKEKMNVWIDGLSITAPAGLEND